MTIETKAKQCPAKECGRPAEHVGEKIVCELGHCWVPTEVLLRCPRCGGLAHHIQVKVDLVACVFCSKPWKFDQLAVGDELKVGIVAGSSACDRIMRAVDNAAAELLGVDVDDRVIREAFQAGWLASAIRNGETTLPEVVARFRRNLIAGGLGQETP